tara:strand:- start:110 stop:568 length:459 start_codon:yes stop_codon:yes gene_type:complete
MASKDYAVVFDVYRPIKKCHKKLLGELQKRIDLWSANSCIADVILEWLPNLSVYEKFASNHGRAKAILEEYWKKEDFQHLVKGLRYGDYRGKRGLNSFTSGGLPVQRLTRYVLMLRSILNYTPGDHPDFASVTKAIALAEEKIISINELMKE